MLTFMTRFGQVQSKLADLLDTKFIPGKRDQITDYVYDVQNRILELHNEGNYDRRDHHLMRLAMFAKHLEELRSKREDLFEDFKQQLKEEDYSHYFGTRFEIDIATSLVRKDIGFEHPDPPDFRISGEDIAIECGSGHFSGGDRTIREKLEQTVDNKSGKPYYNSSSALFIDLTNIFYHNASMETDISNDKLKKWVRDHLETFDLDIGSVVLFTYVADASEESSGLRHSYLRIDNDNSDDKLIEFLDQHWPVEDLYIPETFYPSEP